MGAVAHYGPPVAMQPCYLGADGPLPMPPLQHPCARTHPSATTTARLDLAITCCISYRGRASHKVSLPEPH